MMNDAASPGHPKTHPSIERAASAVATRLQPSPTTPPRRPAPTGMVEAFAATATTEAGALEAVTLLQASCKYAGMHPMGYIGRQGNEWRFSVALPPAEWRELERHGNAIDASLAAELA